MTAKFYSSLLSLDAEMVKKQPTASRLKIITLAQLMLIPMLLWFISGFLISKNLIGISVLKSLIVGIICSVLIYIIDRSFITSFGSKQKWLMNGIRIGFAVMSAILGSLALDLVIFEGDIQTYQNANSQKMAKQYEDEYGSKFLGDLTLLQNDANSARTRHSELIDIYNAEIDGKGTGIKGVGKAANAKKANADEAKTQLDLAELRFQNQKSEIDSAAYAYGVSQTAVDDGAILRKLHDFHQFIAGSKLNILMYAIFFIIMLLIESMLIVYKIGARETVLEKLLLAEEDARNAELDSIKIRKKKLEEANRILGHAAVQRIHQISEN